MTRANRKLWSDYKRLKTTTEYCQGLEADTGIPVSALILEIDSFGEEQSTWVHPEKLSSLGGFSKISGLQAVLIALSDRTAQNYPKALEDRKGKVYVSLSGVTDKVIQPATAEAILRYRATTTRRYSPNQEVVATYSNLQQHGWGYFLASDNFLKITTGKQQPRTATPKK